MVGDAAFAKEGEADITREPVRQRREIDLDVVRGLAILLAMGWHMNHLPVQGPGALLLKPGLAIGWAGVDLFFVLSGFLIGRLIIGEIRRFGDFDFSRFLVRRAFRLWPVVYVFLIAMVAVRYRPWQDFAWQIALHVQNFIPTIGATHLWSLAVEEHFYLLLGAAFPVVFFRFDWRKALPIALVSILFICPIFRLIAVFAGVSPGAIQLQTQFRLDGLAGGVLLAFLSRENPDLFDRLLRLRWLRCAIAAVGVAFLWNVSKGEALGCVLGFSISWISSAAVLLLLYRSGVDRHLRVPCFALAFLGQISYPLYIWHVPVMKIGSTIFERFFGTQYPGLQTVAIYLSAIFVAFFMTKYLEHPLMRVRDRIKPPRSSAVDPSKDESVPSI